MEAYKLTDPPESLHDHINLTPEQEAEGEQILLELGVIDMKYADKVETTNNMLNDLGCTSTLDKAEMLIESDEETRRNAFLGIAKMCGFRTEVFHEIIEECLKLQNDIEPRYREIPRMLLKLRELLNI